MPAFKGFRRTAKRLFKNTLQSYGFGRVKRNRRVIFVQYATFYPKTGVKHLTRGQKSINFAFY